jgi:hypothetical protein
MAMSGVFERVPRDMFCHQRRVIGLAAAYFFGASEC